MNMPIFKNRYLLLFFIGLIFLTEACKKEIINGTYGVNDAPVNSQYITKGKAKSDAQYISILSTNLLQKPISVNELVKTENVIYSIGDRSLAYELIISNYMNSSERQIPDDATMRADVDVFIKATYRRFFVRDPSELEVTFFRNYIESNPNITVELVYTAFAASEEYQFY